MTTECISDGMFILINLLMMFVGIAFGIFIAKVLGFKEEKKEWLLNFATGRKLYLQIQEKEEHLLWKMQKYV